MTLFHASANDYPVGQMIRAGGFGRMIREFKCDTNMHNFETAAEFVRQENFPHLPSRLACVFCCPTLEEMQVFQQRFPGRPNIYEVAPASSDAAVFSQTWAIFFGTNMAAAVNAAWRYWSFPRDGEREVIVGGPVTVLRRL